VSRRLAAVLWVLLGIALWNGVFDLYITRGVREYLQLKAEYELHRGPEPSITEVMSRSRRDGVRAASVWAGVVTIAGLGTLMIGRKSR
jgi:hypothetical protein